MYKCTVCGHTQEGAGEHCGQPMVQVEAEGAPESVPSEGAEGDSQM